MPVLQSIQDLDWERILNTSFLIVDLFNVVWF